LAILKKDLYKMAQIYYIWNLNEQEDYPMRLHGIKLLSQFKAYYIANYILKIDNIINK
jgi:hypothetical protein